MNLKKYITEVKDYPKNGIEFKDITTLLNNVEAFQYTIDQMAKFIETLDVDVIVAPEARGFLLASALAYKTKKRFVLVRKPGKLPRETVEIEYEYEYRKDIQQIHKDDLKLGDRVVIVDDILATGGTVQAILKLIEGLGADIVGISFLADLTDIHSDEILKDYNVNSLIKY